MPRSRRWLLVGLLLAPVLLGGRVDVADLTRVGPTAAPAVHEACQIERASDDPVTAIKQAGDPPADAVDGIPVTGTIRVRTRAQVDRVQVRVNDREPVARPVSPPDTVPGNATFYFHVQLDSTATRVSVTPLSPTRTDPDDAVAAVLRLDGDRLPGDIECSQTHTDPLDPDSNSYATEQNEAANGIVDAKENFDGDRLATSTELDRGTDPTVNDTDGDDVSDGDEVLLLQTDPTDSDTDGDGTPDGAADNDGDGLSNAVELRRESDPNVADSDGDRLADPDEFEAGTNVWDPDTDGDGVTDGAERNGAPATDPLSRDSDGDGTTDGEETLTRRDSSPSGAAVLEVTAEAGDSPDMGVHPENRRIFERSETLSTASASGYFEVSYDGTAVESARVTISYDPAEVPDGDEEDLEVYRYNESYQTFLRVDSSVDTQANTVTADLTDQETPGLYVVLHTPSWECFWDRSCEV